jgi:hypothetical protein
MSQVQNAIPANELECAGHGAHWRSTDTVLILLLLVTKSVRPSGVSEISMPGPLNLAEVAEPSCVCFITAGPITKLCAWGEEESGGHVL